jgi:drug/metabolite transporter (DMT)-like permease
LIDFLTDKAIVQNDKTYDHIKKGRNLLTFAEVLKKIMDKKPIDDAAWLIMIFLSLVWGCSFILIKKALIAFDPVQLACLRLGISSLAFSPFVYKFRKEIPWKDWSKFVAVGLTGSGIPAFLFSFAQTNISSSVAGLLNSLTPIWTLLIGIFVFRLSFNKWKLIGVVLGFLGAASLIILGDQSSIGGNPIYGILIIIATICYASSVNMVQAFFSNIRPIIISSMSFFLIGPPAIIYLFLTDFTTVLKTNSNVMLSFGAVTTLSLMGTFLASILFYNLVQRTNAVFASTVTYLMPIVALAWGIIDGEMVGILHFIGMSTILIGVYITKKA